MRRINRSIETFDISLMAVVTKAMGAFLVLMVLLLPYYTPDPQSRESMEELTRMLSAIKSKVNEVARKLGPEESKSPSAKSLQAAIDELAKAADMLPKMEGMLNKANAENERLREQNRQTEAELEDVKKQMRENEEKVAAAKSRSIMVTAFATGCEDVFLDARLLSEGDERDISITREGKKIALTPESLIMFGQSVNVGTNSWATNVAQPWAPGATAAFSDNKFVSGRLAMAQRFNVDVGNYVLAITKRSPTKKIKVHNVELFAFSRSQANCNFQVQIWLNTGDNNWVGDSALSVTMPADAVGGLLLGVAYTDKGFTFQTVRDNQSLWFDTLLAKAVAVQTEQGIDSAKVVAPRPPETKGGAPAGDPAQGQRGAEGSGRSTDGSGEPAGGLEELFKGLR